MEGLIRQLSAMQTREFFEKNAPTTQAQCDAEAARITNESVRPAAMQGGNSYTVTTESQSIVIQFRASNSALDLAFLKGIEPAYKGFVPHHESLGRLDTLHIYRMNNVGGVAAYLARDQLRENDCVLLQQTVQDYAKFFTSAWYNTPESMTSADGSELCRTYDAQLALLYRGLPSRFRQTLTYARSRLPELFAEDWPMVPNHTDLLENNIHVDTTTGGIVGICDWKDAELSPFGMSLGGLESLLGYRRRTAGWTWLPNQQALRDIFWATFDEYIGGLRRAPGSC